jgi:hypothetical protein
MIPQSLIQCSKIPSTFLSVWWGEIYFQQRTKTIHRIGIVLLYLVGLSGSKDFIGKKYA